MLGLLALPGIRLAAQTSVEPYAVPQLIGDGWEREDPAAAGFDAGRLRPPLDSLPARERRLHGLIIERHGRLVIELYRPGKDESPYLPFAYRRSFGPTTLHDLRSVGKSVVGLLFGIARQEGAIGDLSRPVLDFYPEYADLATPARRAITLEHLLTMSSGLAWQEGGGFPDDEHRLVWKWSPYRYILEHPVLRAPGSTFSYHSGGTALLADIIARSTGMPFKDFARTRLFEPMGIHDWAWTPDMHGRTRVYDGLRMRPRDLAKIGRMVLDQGRWKGRQIVPADWIAVALQPRLGTGFDDVQYGYQWWTGTLPWQGRSLRWHAAFGLGNQRLFVVPDLDLCVVVTAGAYGEDLPSAARRINTVFKDIVATLRP
ncbi:MAG TPA: serine hydrolase [Geothrix sp.]|nr:serine hydrolase [Geothrix sp.]